MFGKIFLPLCLVTCAMIGMAARSQAAIVSFAGNMQSGSGSVLGTLPPGFDFSITLDFTEDTAGFASINGGVFSSSVATLTLTGGDIIVTENGSSDQALFAIDSSNPSGSFSTTFLGDAISDNRVTTANLVDLINAAGATTISANFGSGGSYTGRITSAVPEPSSGLLLLGLVGSLVGARRRRST